MQAIKSHHRLGRILDLQQRVSLDNSTFNDHNQWKKDCAPISSALFIFSRGDPISGVAGNNAGQQDGCQTVTNSPEITVDKITGSSKQKRRSAHNIGKVKLLNASSAMGELGS